MTIILYGNTYYISEYSFLNEKVLQVPHGICRTGGNNQYLGNTQPEESGGKFCLVCFVHLFLFSFEILELFYVQNFFVNFVNTSSNWSKMSGFIFAFFFLWLLLSVMNFFTGFLLFLISMELRGKLHLSFNLVKTSNKHRICH